MITGLIFIAILVVLIVSHEFGHFIVAKIFGVRVDEFGVGYPPRAFLLAKIGETEYTLNWIPFGGFVRLYGEDEDAHGKGSFVEAPRIVQALILIAGVVANALVAWILFASALHAGIPRVIESQSSHTTDSSRELVVSSVVAASPASAAGISAGDVLIRMIDKTGTMPKDLTPHGVSDYVKTRGGTRITISYVRGGATSTTTIIPANAVIPDHAATAALGIGMVEVSSIALPWQEAIIQGFVNTRSAFIAIATSLWERVPGVSHVPASFDDVVGPVGLVGVVGDAAQHGLGSVLALAGFIAVNLAIINLIPIPVLDGGRLMLVILEAIIRRPVPKLMVQVLNTAGIALIIILMIVVTYHDIARLFI